MDLKQLLSQTIVCVEDSVIEAGEVINEEVSKPPGVQSPGVQPPEVQPPGVSKPPVETLEFGSDLEEDDEDKKEEKEEKLDPRFTLLWNKLEKGVKMNRLLIFIQSEKEENTLTEQQAKELKNLLFKACENGLFNKISDVEYDESNAEIKSIKNLEFNESSKKYKIKTGGTKNRSVSKSRSNIDRLTKKN